MNRTNCIAILQFFCRWSYVTIILCTAWDKTWIFYLHADILLFLHIQFSYFMLLILQCISTCRILSPSRDSVAFRNISSNNFCMIWSTSQTIRKELCPTFLLNIASVHWGLFTHSSLEIPLQHLNWDRLYLRYCNWGRLTGPPLQGRLWHLLAPTWIHKTSKLSESLI